MESFISTLRRAKLVLAVVSVQAGNAVLTVVCTFAIREGMYLETFMVYRMAIATAIVTPFALIFDRKPRPRMTFSIIANSMLCSLFDPLLTQYLFYLGLKHSTATFSSAMSNIVPAFAFFMAWAFRLEKVDIRSLHSLVKVMGTMVTVGGAVMLTLVTGPSLSLPWAKKQQLHPHQQSESRSNSKNLVEGALLITASCLSWSFFLVLQTYTVQSYPCQLSLSALICFWGMVEAALVALVMEWRNIAAWSVHLDMKCLSAVLGGMISGTAYYVIGIVVKERGPVFYSAFNPLCTVMVAVLGSIVLAEQMYLGSLIGTIIIFVGLYMVLWGKTKDQQPPSDSERQRNNEHELQTIGP